MDPIEFLSPFQSVPEIILQHFSGKELLTLSEVSHSYYEVIASSTRLMTKIRLVFKCDRVTLTPQDSEILNNSLRLYQNFEIRCQHGTEHRSDLRRRGCESEEHHFHLEPIFNFVIKSKHVWSDVKFRNTVCADYRFLFVQLLLSIGPTVETLVFDNENALIYPPPLDDSWRWMVDLGLNGSEEFDFPRLKKFKVINLLQTIEKPLLVFFMNCKNVEDFTMEEEHPDDLLVVARTIRGFGNLKHLKLSCRDLKSVFRSEKWTQFTFKLESFTLVPDMSGLITPDAQPNLLKFLASQCESLQQLDFNDSTSPDLLKIIMKMPRLKSLSIYGANWHCPSWHNPNHRTYYALEDLPSIVHLRVYTNYIYSLQLVEALLKATPNVKTLQFDVIKKETIQYLLSAGKTFETLSVNEIKTCLTEQSIYEQKIKEKLTDNFINTRKKSNDDLEVFK